MMPDRCALCQRKPKRGTSEHHLIPRKLHSNKWFKKRFSRDEMHETISVCPDCHRAIHELIPDQKEVGRHYHTVELLCAHPAIQRFLAWAGKQK